jgi:hypothetical protein
MATSEGVSVNAPGGTDPALRDELISGAGQGLVAHARGAAVLHGSCVRWNGHGLCFVGPQSRGKSTLTAWLATQGAEHVSDGMTIVGPETRRLVWRRPRWRLGDDSVEFLGYRPDAVLLDDPYRLKRSLAAPRKPHHGDALLDAVFALEEGLEVELVSLHGAEQIIALVRDWYLATSLPPSESPLVLDRASRLLRAGVRVVRLIRPKQWSVFPAIAAALKGYLGILDAELPALHTRGP